MRFDQELEQHLQAAVGTGLAAVVALGTAVLTAWYGLLVALVLKAFWDHWISLL